MRLLALGILLGAGPVRAATPAQPEQEMPALMRLMVSKTKSGLFVRLPVIDTDPNRGVTVGVMPVWVVMGASETIRHIHAPAVTYNAYVGFALKYEYFYFPSSKSNYLFRTSWAQKFDREVVTEFSTDSLFDTPWNFDWRFEYSKDSTRRFFGFGPNTQQSGESNYTLDTVNYRFAAGYPLREGSPLRINVRHQFQTNDITGGSVNPLDDLVNRFPDVAADVTERHHDASLGAYLNYDTRDSPVTTSRGAYAEVFVDASEKNRVTSEYTYHRYGAEVKAFRPTLRADDPEPRFITAGRVRFEDVKGRVPFWLMPELGGKYSLRAFGEGRFTDHGLMVFSAEQRCRISELKIKGIRTSFWLDPFFGLGTVFPAAKDAQLKFFHPSYGVALRVVGRPQIVGSADFAFGPEGLKVYLDINFSF